MSTVSGATSTQNWGDIQELIANQSGSKNKTAGPGDVASKDVFLQLLVAQLKHQNPLDPADGTEFVAQLAQFTQLEQSLGMREDLTAIREALESAGLGSTTQNP